MWKNVENNIAKMLFAMLPSILLQFLLFCCSFFQMFHSFKKSHGGTLMQVDQSSREINLVCRSLVPQLVGAQISLLFWSIFRNAVNYVHPNLVRRICRIHGLLPALCKKLGDNTQLLFLQALFFIFDIVECSSVASCCSSKKQLSQIFMRLNSKALWL